MLNNVEILLRLGLAVIVGFAVGFEREHHHRPAGIKTHIMVCMGATVISLIQLEMIQDVIIQVANNPDLANVLKTDYGRLGAQVISGIGFLGAGTIMRTKGSIKGLTTAATLWIVACIGLGIGMGYYFLTIAATSIVMIILTLLRFFQASFRNRKGMKVLEFRFINKRETMSYIREYFKIHKVSIKSIDILDDQDELMYNNKPIIYCSYTVLPPKKADLKAIIDDLSMDDNIIKVAEYSE